jgi:23S rRNA (uracil1939-C5)-methyltransferase
MLARHHGQVVLVDDAIPGERLVARVERVGKGVVFARTVDVLSASPDRRAPSGDRRCGGNVFAHIGYPRQLQLKGEIIRDALARIARMPLPDPPLVQGSPETGYRMRARLHAHGGRLGFFREGTHDLCGAPQTGQLLADTHAWIAEAEEVLLRNRVTGLSAVDIGESVAGDQRVCHLELEREADPRAFAALGGGLTGLSAHRAGRDGMLQLAGTATLTDILHVREGDPASALRLRRHVLAFYQGNRFLLEPLVRHVLSLVAPGPVIDLYAGVGLFGLSLAATGRDQVTLVEGDPISAADLDGNAEAFADRVRVAGTSVEEFLAAPTPAETIIVDPPRTGLSRSALAGVIRAEPARLVYVSCDVATLARDARTLGDAGYALTHVSGLDLFPNTAHVEGVAGFEHRSG